MALAKSQQLSVTDTAGRLRTVRDYLKRIEGPEGTLSSGLKTFHLKYARPEDVLPILRQLLEIPEDKNVRGRRFDPRCPGGRQRSLAGQRAARQSGPRQRNHRGARRGRPPAPKRQPCHEHSPTGSLSLERLRWAVGPGGLADGPGRADRRESFRRFQDGQPDRPGASRPTCARYGPRSRNCSTRDKGWRSSA